MRDEPFGFPGSVERPVLGRHLRGELPGTGTQVERDRGQLDHCRGALAGVTSGEQGGRSRDMGRPVRRSYPHSKHTFPLVPVGEVSHFLGPRDGLT
jgi:hypothetical protein